MAVDFDSSPIGSRWRPAGGPAGLRPDLCREHLAGAGPGGRQRGPDAPAVRPVLLGLPGRAANGSDRPIYLTNEESGGAESFDGRGGQSVAIFDNELHTLPALGRSNVAAHNAQLRVRARPNGGLHVVVQFPTPDGTQPADELVTGHRT
jgi:hypothetical protein